MFFDDVTVKTLLSCAYDAGQAILVHSLQVITPEEKADGTFVTKADQAAHDIIDAAISRLALGHPIVSEEGHLPDPGSIGSTFWLIDPLDGTNQFIKGRLEYTVNIALIHEGRPVFGIIYHPPTNAMYLAHKHTLFTGKGIVIEPLVRKKSPPNVVFIGSAKEQHDIDTHEIQGLIDKNYTVAVQRSSLKFCSLVEGHGSMYYRGRPSYEWDTAAGHALILCLGGKIVTLEGRDLLYGKANFENPGFLVKV